MSKFFSSCLGLFRRSTQPAAVIAEFNKQYPDLVKQFLERARATGLPRGLNWISLEPREEPVFVREAHTQRIVALVAAIVQFEAIAGSDMEYVPQACEPRPVVAMFFFERGKWQTTGRTVFNLTPEQVIQRGKGQFEVINQHPT